MFTFFSSTVVRFLGTIIHPILRDLLESGAIVQDSDVIIALYRESYYNEECEDPIRYNKLRKLKKG